MKKRKKKKNRRELKKEAKFRSGKNL